MAHEYTYSISARREQTAIAVKQALEATQRGDNRKLCNFCMVSSGSMTSRAGGGYTDMAGWTQALDRHADQWLIQGSELKT